MSDFLRKIWTRAVVFLAAPATLMGCVEFTVDTTLNPDGGGTRVVSIQAGNPEELQEYNLTNADFKELLHLSESNGWAYETHIDAGDTTHAFSRERRILELSDWSRLSGDVRIDGALQKNAADRLGYVTLGDVEFRNRILVGANKRSDGRASFSYMETFLWQDVVEALLEVVVLEMDTRLMESFPGLEAQDRGEILGLAKGSLWEAVEDGVLDSDTDGDMEDQLWARAVEKTATQAVRVVQKSQPGADTETLAAALNIFQGEPEEAFVESFVSLLPGLNLAINSEVHFRLTMPGEVTNSNAHEQEGNTLIWTFTPIDALTTPVILTAESVMEG